VKVVTMDMWRPYRDAVRAILPDAAIVVDKFHVVRMATQAVDSVRKRLRDTMNTTARRKMMRSRYLLLKRNSSLNANDRATLDDWTTAFPALYDAYRAKEDFLALWDLPTRADAEKGIKAWREGLPPATAIVFKPLLTALDNWHEEIIGYWHHRETNALTEALNGIAKIINRQGRGYSFKAIRAKLLYAKRLQAARPAYGKDEIVLLSSPDDIEVFTRAEVPSTVLKGVSIRRLSEFLEEQASVERAAAVPFDRNNIHIIVPDRPDDQ
jgi:transposase